MGLHGRVDCLFPDETTYMHYPIDYSDAINQAADDFLEQAQSDVPVDTGTLQASISTSVNHYGFDAYADTNYAEYVEYGTYKMDAQPYFVPALEAAVGQLEGFAQDIYNEAMQQDKEDYQAMMQEQMEQQKQQALSGLGGFIADILSAIIIGIINGLMQVLNDMLFGNSQDNTYDGDDMGGGIGYDIDIY